MAISSISGRAGAPARVINPMTVTTPAAHVAPSRSAIGRRFRGGGGVVRRVIGRSQGEPPSDQHCGNHRRYQNVGLDGDGCGDPPLKRPG